MSFPLHTARSFAHPVIRLAFRLLTLSAFVFSGCLTAQPPVREPQPAASIPTASSTPAQASADTSLALREGDVIQVNFPSSPNLNTVQTIRHDGRVVLPIIGEITAAGYTPADLSAELVRRFSPQLVHKDVYVSLVSSPFSVFVSGAVLRPGKITSDRPLTALEAIMEAGGFDSTKADMKAVVVIRNGKALPNKLNLKRVLDGKDAVPFNLKPGDIVHVPDRLVIF